MLLYERVFAERDGVEIKVEGSSGQVFFTVSNQDRISVGRSDAAAVLREEGTLWNHVESSKQRQALVEDVTHDMAVPSAAEQLHRQVSESHVRPACQHRPDLVERDLAEGTGTGRFVRNVRSDSSPASATSEHWVESLRAVRRLAVSGDERMRPRPDSAFPHESRMS